MKHKIFSKIVILSIVILLAACSASSEESGGESPADAAAGGKAGLVEALTGAGAEVTAGDELEQPFFSVKGQVYQVNGADVQVFEYASAEDMEADASQVDPSGGSVGTSMMSWMATPHFFKHDRVLVLYVGDDAGVLGLLEGALGAQFAGR